MTYTVDPQNPTLVLGEDGKLIARIEHRLLEECIEHARIMAAAPDLLNALTALLTATELNTDEMEQETRDMCYTAHCAISKAMGLPEPDYALFSAEEEGEEE